MSIFCIGLLTKVRPYLAAHMAITTQHIIERQYILVTSSRESMALNKNNNFDHENVIVYKFD